MRKRPCFRRFCHCEGPSESVSQPANAYRRQVRTSAGVFRIIMEDTTQKSCWGVTAKAVIGFAGILLLAWLVGGSETVAVLATS
jgi:hypothetical protein